MFQKYDIINYDNSNITFRFNNNDNKIITIDINQDYIGYEYCYNYYFYQNKSYKINESNEEQKININNNLYDKYEQYKFDKYLTKYPISPNGLLYKYLKSIYYKLFN